MDPWGIPLFYHQCFALPFPYSLSYWWWCCLLNMIRRKIWHTAFLQLSLFIFPFELALFLAKESSSTSSLILLVCDESLSSLNHCWNTIFSSLSLCFFSTRIWQHITQLHSILFWNLLDSLHVNWNGQHLTVLSVSICNTSVYIWDTHFEVFQNFHPTGRGLSLPKEDTYILSHESYPKRHWLC